MQQNEWGFEKCCPVCKDTYVHFNKPVLTESNDICGSAWQGRGDAIRLPMWCEQGHSWYVRYGEHKGNMFVKNEIVYDQDFSQSPRLSECCHADMVNGGMQCENCGSNGTLV